MDTEKQRIAAMRVLEALGYTWHGGAWQPPMATSPAGSDAMRAAPAHRRDALARLAGPRLKGLGQEAELRAIANLETR
jgi:hypothetical protein